MKGNVMRWSTISLTVAMVMTATAGLAAEGRFKIAYSTYLGGNKYEEAREIIRPYWK